MKTLDCAAFADEFTVAARSRGYRVETLAETDAGPVIAAVVGGGGEPAYLSAGIHGDEPAGPLAALKLLREGFFDEGRAWMICPALNPTGLAAGCRENAEGCDLNRDYLRRRCVETSAHARWLEGQPVPQHFFSLHEDWESSGFYFYEINLGAECPRHTEAILKAVQPWFSPEPEARIDDHDVRSPGWIFHRAEADFPDHWPEAIFMAKRGCPRSYTFETPSASDLSHRIAAHVAAVEAAMRVAG